MNKLRRLPFSSSTPSPIVCIISLLLGAIVTGCSVDYPVDSTSCEYYGDTVWDRCWWFNNSWAFGFCVSGALYAWGWTRIYRRETAAKKSGSLIPVAYFFFGTAIVFFGGGVAASLIFESLLRNS